MVRARFRTPLSRVYVAAVWFGVAGCLFAALPRIGNPVVLHLLSIAGAFGAGVGTIAGHPIIGAAVAVACLLIYGFAFPIHKF